MLTLSNGTIYLNQSIYYWRLALLLHLFAAFMLYQSAFIVPLKLLIFLLLIGQLIFIYFNPHPHVYRKIVYVGEEWLLYADSLSPLVFDKQKVILEAGILFLLQLSNEHKKKVIVVFFDQVLAADYRLLRIIQKIS